MNVLAFIIGCFLVSSTYALQTVRVSDERSFTIDYENDCFLKDGKPFSYIAGGFHYFRVPREYWNDRLRKAKAMGLNAIQTYIAWNIHEPSEGKFNFEQENDLLHFIDLCEKNGLLVILRPGPYIDAEWEYGGFPWWLTKHVTEFRTSRDRVYMKYVRLWFTVLLTKLKPLLYKFGGPIIAMQVENEYSNYYACDHLYLLELQVIYDTYLGKNNVVLFTTDSHGFECGSIPSLYTTIDFGISSDVEEAFKKQRKFEPRGPLVNSEFYTGWQDFWGLPHSKRDSSKIAQHLDKMLTLNASVKLYMFQGGTNFGFMNGNDVYNDDGFLAAPTTYDYDAPLTEAGDPSEKYFAIRRVIKKHRKEALLPVPKPSKKIAYGKIPMHSSVSLSQLISHEYPKGAPFKSVEKPLTMEEIDQAYGFLLYRTILPLSLNSAERTVFLSAEVHDRSTIIVDGKRVGSVKRGAVNVTIEGGKQIDILVENEGRLCYGSHGIKYLPDPKGIIGYVYINSKVQKKWEMFPINDSNFLRPSQWIHKTCDQTVNDNSNSGNDSFHMFYKATFTITDVADTFIKMEGWGKGQIFINSLNVGRYWQTQPGPQKTLYVPKTALKAGKNQIVVMELDKAPCAILAPQKCVVEFLDKPILV